MKKIKFAVVGFGRIGKRHAETIVQNPSAELVALIDVQAKENVQLQSFNVPYFSSLESFFQSNIYADVINIATPNGLHAQQAVQCLQNGFHVVIEKPIALKTIDAQKIIDAAKVNNKRVFVVMQNRYSPVILWLKNFIEENVLGKIFMVEMNCFWNRDKRYYNLQDWHGNKEMDGGTLFTQFSHFIDIFYWLFGDIKDIQSKFRSFNHKNLTAFEDSGIINFEFGNESLGSLNFTTSAWDKNLESSITIIAENGSIKIGGQYMNKIEYCHIKDYNVANFDVNKTTSNHSFIIQNVIDVLNDKLTILTNAEDGLKVVDIIERMYSAAESSERTSE